MSQLEFIRPADPSLTVRLINEAIASFTGPQDGMWEAFRTMADQWLITLDQEPLGYACVNAENQLIQFYLEDHPDYRREDIFGGFINRQGITTAIAGTNNPWFFNLALPIQSDVSLHTYLFTHQGGIAQVIEGITKAVTSDLAKLVDAYHLATGAPKDWLTAYLGNLINREELFFLEENGVIVGGCEVRKSETNQQVADVGMVVHPDFRKMGNGTLLLTYAVNQASLAGRQAICSCEAGNIGSRKAIERTGFTTRHALYRISF